MPTAVEKYQQLIDKCRELKRRVDTAPSRDNQEDWRAYMDLIDEWTRAVRKLGRSRASMRKKGWREYPGGDPALPGPMLRVILGGCENTGESQAPLTVVSEQP